MIIAYTQCIRMFLSVAGFVVGSSVLHPAISVATAADSLSMNLGSIDFPNSGASEAQPAFLTGMKAFHSFEFEDAREAFRAHSYVSPVADGVICGFGAHSYTLGIRALVSKL